MPEHTLFPSILPEADEPFVDDAYSKGELKRKDYSELQSIAAQHPSEDVHGRMDQDAIIEGLTGLERV